MAVEVQDALHQRVRVLHLVERLLADLVPEPLVAPVLTEAGVQPVLVDGRELAGEDVVQERDDLGIAFHGDPSYRKVSQASTEPRSKPRRNQRIWSFDEPWPNV